MVYKNNIPQPGDSPATASQADLLENMAQLDSQFGTAGDHVEFTASSDNGFHKRIRFNGVIADPNLPDPQASLYLKTVAGDSQLYFENFDVGVGNVVRQMTGLVITDLVNAGTAGGTLYRVDLPIGITVYMGQTNAFSGNATVTFPVAYTTIYSTTVTANDTNVQRTSVTQGTTGLTIYTENSVQVNWIAIGTI